MWVLGNPAPGQPEHLTHADVEQRLPQRVAQEELFMHRLLEPQVWALQRARRQDNLARGFRPVDVPDLQPAGLVDDELARILAPVDQNAVLDAAEVEQEEFARIGRRQIGLIDRKRDQPALAKIEPREGLGEFALDAIKAADREKVFCALEARFVPDCGGLGKFFTGKRLAARVAIDRLDDDWPNRGRGMSVGTCFRPSSLAASTRPCPARICPSSSIRTGLVKPKRSMLFAIWRSCFLECVRAFRGLGVSSSIGRSIMAQSGRKDLDIALLRWS